MMNGTSSPEANESATSEASAAQLIISGFNLQSVFDWSWLNLQGSPGFNVQKNRVSQRPNDIFLK